MAATGKIHYAKLENSGRLQRLLKFLSDGKEKTTREIIRGADICAVNSSIDELRENNFDIRCRMIEKNVWGYTLVEDLRAYKQPFPDV